MILLLRAGALLLTLSEKVTFVSTPSDDKGNFDTILE